VCSFSRFSEALDHSGEIYQGTLAADAIYLVIEIFFKKT
jgi:hypothetical protein